MSEFVMIETPLPRFCPSITTLVTQLFLKLSLGDRLFAREWVLLAENTSQHEPWRSNWSMSLARRLECLVTFDVLCACWYGLEKTNLLIAFQECDMPRGFSSANLNVKGFWRVDKDKDPELRHTVLTLIAFHDLEAKIREHGGDRDAGIAAFLAQNDGEGWLLPETLRLADYGLGHDERAQHHQPVASRLGPRFYDWQLTQTAEESWRECHLHARNLLGETGYQKLLAEIEGHGTTPVSTEPPAPQPSHDGRQIRLFEDGNEQKTLFD